jgi:hypothetical protein
MENWVDTHDDIDRLFLRQGLAINKRLTAETVDFISVKPLMHNNVIWVRLGKTLAPVRAEISSRFITD